MDFQVRTLSGAFRQARNGAKPRHGLARVRLGFGSGFGVGWKAPSCEVVEGHMLWALWNPCTTVQKPFERKNARSKPFVSMVTQFDGVAGGVWISNSLTPVLYWKPWPSNLPAMDSSALCPRWNLLVEEPWNQVTPGGRSGCVPGVPKTTRLFWVEGPSTFILVSLSSGLQLQRIPASHEKCIRGPHLPFCPPLGSTKQRVRDAVGCQVVLFLRLGVFDPRPQARSSFLFRRPKLSFPLASLKRTSPQRIEPQARTQSLDLFASRRCRTRFRKNQRVSVQTKPSDLFEEERKHG